MLARKHTHSKTNLDYLGLERSIQLPIGGENPFQTCQHIAQYQQRQRPKRHALSTSPPPLVRRGRHGLPLRNARSAKFWSSCSSAKPSANRRSSSMVERARAKSSLRSVATSTSWAVSDACTGSSGGGWHAAQARSRSRAGTRLPPRRPACAVDQHAVPETRGAREPPPGLGSRDRPGS